ncbi:MAG TPA: sigma-70 family RNA polymerase sigma factor [Planctomycetaceae bacterium]
MDDRTRDLKAEWLALRCRQGDPAAFTELVAEFERPLAYFASKLLGGDDDLALDVLQDVWLRAFRSFRRLERPDRVRAWLYRLARGLAIDRIRKERSVGRLEREHADGRPEGEEPSFSAEDAAAVHAVIDTLPLEQREAIVLHFIEGMSHEAIAEVVDCPVGTVKSRLHRAKQELRRRLEAHQR